VSEVRRNWAVLCILALVLPPFWLYTLAPTALPSVVPWVAAVSFVGSLVAAFFAADLAFVIVWRALRISDDDARRRWGP
jgi:hypothetical protein